MKNVMNCLLRGLVLFLTCHSILQAAWPAYARVAQAEAPRDSANTQSSVEEEKVSLDDLDSEPSTSASDLGSVSEEEIDLDDLGEPAEKPGSSPGKTHGGSHGTGKSPHGGGHGRPVEAVITVDGTMEGFMAEKKELSFSSNHEYVVLSATPSPRVSFQIELIEVVYWELGLTFSRNAHLKLGKIGIPFGPLFLHQLLAGLVEKPLSGGGGHHFMVPYVWTEYGLSYYHRLVDSYTWELAATAWLTNGLQGDVKVPDRTVDFTRESPSWDNNLDKALGARVTNRILGKYVLNFSFYTCKWSDDRLNNDGTRAENFYQGDRVILGNADVELPYNMVPLPFLRNFKFRYEYALLRTRSTQFPSADKDLRVPWHNKSADFLEVTYNGLRRWADLRFRAGTYDDNWNVKNSRDLVNYNLAAIFKVMPGVEFIPMYMWNREKVNEVRDDAVLIKCFVRI